MTGVITWVIDSRDGVYIGGKHLRHNSHNSKTMTTNTIQAQFVADNVDEELSIDQLSDVNGAAVWGILAPVAASFAAGYAVGTVLGKATGLID